MSAAPAPGSAAAEWKNGWTLVLACFVGFSFTSIMASSLTMFLEPVGQEFGWSRALVSSGYTVAAAVGAVLSPFFGVVIDRFGPRRVAIPGVIATAFAIAGFALANGSELQWVLLWAVYAVIAVSVKPTVWTAAVAGMFTRGQGLALGITLCGTAAAQIILPPLAYWLIEEFGWRMAYFWLGTSWGCVTLLACWFFLRDAYGRKDDSAAAVVERPQFPGLTIPQAWRDSALWRLGISTLIVMSLSMGLSIHQVPILNEAGVSRLDAALRASLAGIAAVAGKLATGALLDRYPPNWVGGLTLVFSALSFGLLIDGIHSPALITFAMLVNGYTQGTKVQIVSYLTARYAGLRNFGTIFGVMHSIMAFSAGSGPILAGLAYDFGGNYTLFLIAGSIGSVVGGALLFTLPAYPKFAAPAAA